MNSAIVFSLKASLIWGDDAPAADKSSTKWNHCSQAKAHASQAVLQCFKIPMISARLTMKLRRPELHELPVLSALCLRSKAVWGYDRRFLEACRAELTIRAEELQRTALCVAEHDGAIVGVAQVIVDGAVADLQKMFVEPRAIGLGVGRSLFAWAVSTAKDLGAQCVTIDADPGAVGFYTRMGAIELGSAPSGSIPGRMLPRLRIDL
jgi:GNAT superfamily N-acetyltransferase